MIPTKWEVVCLTSSYYIKHKCPVNIIFLPDACEACTNTFYLPARNSLSKEVDSRILGSKLTKFTFEYKDIYGFALIIGLQILNLPTTDELTKLATEIPEMQKDTIQSLNTKLRKINSTNNYFYYYRNSIHGCCNMTGNSMLSGKHLNKKRKSNSIS